MLKFGKKKVDIIADRVVELSVGKVILHNSIRARRVSIRVKSNGEITLTMPVICDETAAIHFLETKSDWIRKQLVKTSKRHPRQIIEMPYSTRRHSLRFIPSNTNHTTLKVSSGMIEIYYPNTIRFDNEIVQNTAKKGIEEAWRIEAKEYLPIRIAEISTTTGLKYREISIRNSRTRWGSCSSRDNISLSLHLMKLPDHLIDYVITHELCHTRHKNHGKKFHSLLDSLLDGKEKALSKELRAYSTRW